MSTVETVAVVFGGVIIAVVFWNVIRGGSLRAEARDVDDSSHSGGADEIGD